MKHRKRQLKIMLAVVAFAIAIVVYMKFFNGNLIYLTTGTNSSTLFKIEDKTATKTEAEVLFSDAKKQYEEFLGTDVWSQNIDGISFEEYAKNQIKSKLIRIKCMNILAKERGVVLDRTETADVEKAAKEYMAGLTSEQISSMGVTENEMVTMYTEFAIAKRLFADMTSQVATEVSSDKARVITVQYICAGSDTDINAAKAKLDAGNSFFGVAHEYNAEGEYEYELKRGEMDTTFEDAAFNLKAGETSQILHCNEKYYIIKCISDNEKTKTEANKNDIIEKQKLSEFNKVFESYEASRYVDFNQSLWEKCKLSSANKTSVNFEDIFNNYFK